MSTYYMNFRREGDEQGNSTAIVEAATVGFKITAGPDGLTTQKGLQVTEVTLLAFLGLGKDHGLSLTMLDGTTALYAPGNWPALRADKRESTSN